MDAAEQAIRAAVERAEQMAGDNIENVVINVSLASHAQSWWPVRSSIGGHGITEHDMRRLLDPSVLMREARDDREIVHKIPVGFTVDGNRGVRDPIGMFGEVLGANVHVVTAADGAAPQPAAWWLSAVTCTSMRWSFRRLPQRLPAWSMTKRKWVRPVSISAAAPPALRYSLTASWCTPKSFRSAVITSPMTSRVVCRTPFAHAERMKNLYGTCLPSPSDDAEVIQVPLVGEDDETGTVQVARSMLVGIIRPRVEEIIEIGPRAAGESRLSTSWRAALS